MGVISFETYTSLPRRGVAGWMSLEDTNWGGWSKAGLKAKQMSSFKDRIAAFNKKLYNVEISSHDNSSTIRQGKKQQRAPRSPRERHSDMNVADGLAFMEGKTELMWDWDSFPSFWLPLFPPPHLPSSQTTSLGWHYITDAGAERLAEALKVNSTVTDIE
jgi:hypothetical protein